MFIDIVLPKNNEAKLIEMGVRLGIKHLCLAYKQSQLKTKCADFEKLEKKEKRLSLHLGCITEKGTWDKKTGLSLAMGENNVRSNLEKSIDLVFDVETSNRKDFMHQRNAGMNDVLCKIAHEKNVVVGFSFSSILKSKKNMNFVLGRVMQNIRLCKKYKVPMFIGTFSEEPYQLRGQLDLMSLGAMLGLDAKEIKKGAGILLKKLQKTGA